ncbi:uncharacterized protein LOC126692711 [Quercus robur]|uniref:uncharacterized protein LOC126692711 n=1 Tax=Quercus robur TaxID=38942 RepID=UPI002162A408|nr:uncharacterized protein LOC126692711 [Quercus robur]
MSQIDLEQGVHRRDFSADGSVCFSDAEAEEGSCYSQFYSTNGGSYDEYRFSCVYDPSSGIGNSSGSGSGSGSGRESMCSASASELEVESEVPEIKVHLAKVERDCRICHLGLESNSHESGIPIELGCSCKDDLGAAHKNCAEAWFKIRGNKTCEICNSVARNVFGSNDIELTQHSNETNNATAPVTVLAPATVTETHSFWHGHRFLNFLLACMVFAFVLSWLFHFNVPSS